jgi:hypothetical protein
MILARLCILLGLAAGALYATSEADAWTSNVFHSPSGNIRCAYRPWNESVVCATASTRRSVTHRA